MKKLFLLVASIAVVFGACGPSWGECKSCVAGEESTESVDGTEQIPVDVNVTVVVNVDVDQNQEQSQTQSQTQNLPVPPSDPGVDAGPSFDAGTKVDSGTPDAGKPVCRKVCTCVTKAWKCEDGKTYSKKPSYCKRCYVISKCLKEVTKCN